MYSTKQCQAKEIYFNTDQTQEQIADILDLNRKTIYLWIKKGHWDEMKANAVLAPGFVQHDVYRHIGAINKAIFSRDPDDQIPTMEEVDKIKKLVSVGKMIERNHAGSYIEAFEDLIRYTMKIDLPFSIQITEYADKLVQACLNNKVMEHRDCAIKRAAQIRETLKKMAEEPPVPEVPKGQPFPPYEQEPTTPLEENIPQEQTAPQQEIASKEEIAQKEEIAPKQEIKVDVVTNAIKENVVVNAVEDENFDVAGIENFDVAGTENFHIVGAEKFDIVGAENIQPHPAHPAATPPEPDKNEHNGAQWETLKKRN